MFPDDPNIDRPPDAPRDAVHDRRIRPRGVLPRHLQTWIMVGLAAAMLFIIVVTGRPAPTRRSSDTATVQASTSGLPPDRLRRYQELGPEGLRERSRRPLVCPHATKAEVVGKIIHLRQNYHSERRRSRWTSTASLTWRSAT